MIGTRLAGLVMLWVALGSVLSAQPLTWERVGDIPFSAEGMDFDENGTLWASGFETYRLPPGGTTWIEVCGGAECRGDVILALHPDTLIVGNFGKIFRSVDAGQTWSVVGEEDGVLYGVPLDWPGTPTSHPHAGLLLSGRFNNGDIAYSDDRGATWVRAGFEVNEPFGRTGRDFTAFPPGHPFAHRLLAACLGGMAYSDDGGRLWHYSSFWQTFAAEAVSTVVGPDGTAYAWGYQNGLPGFAIYASTDGATWERRGAPPGFDGTLLIHPDTDVPGPQGTLLTVTGFEPSPSGPSVYGSVDGGWTWTLLGRLPLDPDIMGTPRADAALFGPDGRLYVSLDRSGGNFDWVYRSTSPVVVAREPGPILPASADFTLGPARPNPSTGRTVVPFTLSEAATVRVVVYDVLGREVALLADGRLGPGRHEVVFDGAHLSKGTYVIEARLGETAGQRQSVTVTLRE